MRVASNDFCFFTRIHPFQSLENPLVVLETNTASSTSQAWRLGQEPRAVGSNSAQPADAITDADVELLNRRLGEAAAAAEGAQQRGESHDEDATVNQFDQSSSFVASTDAELADALNARIVGMDTTASGTIRHAGSVDAVGEGATQALTGTELRELIAFKYGKQYDVSFVRRDIPGKTIVAFNIYHAYLGQRSFPMTEQDYQDKLDGVAMYLQAWGQANKVVSFLKEPIAPRRGLPSRPVIGNAVSVQLDLTREQISEWFGRGT
jgi:hypothetical protein